MLERKVLIIEDDPDIADLIEIHLRDSGYKTAIASDGIEGVNKALNNEYFLIILDLMLPKLDGFDVCRRIREEKKTIPILILTSKSEEFDKVLGLELGADDYITKPFSIRELMARVKAILRRVDAVKEEASAEEKPKEIEFDDLVINMEKRKVTLNEEVVELTAKEFDLLVLFASHPG
ncbi:response regulator transcription factor, partial [Candidatus Saccharibacteria bacterium]|nr:response regulator transcription factor [Candidatus Saccharibacteria bacterium]NIV72677.1 response regulator [Calditrichia bacterium]NIW79574.1 response regulator [Calditrichia bacterium]